MLRQMAAEDAPEAAAAELKAKAERHENEVSIATQSASSPTLAPPRAKFFYCSCKILSSERVGSSQHQSR